MAQAPHAVAQMLGLLGDEWTLLTVQRALLGATRYGDFKSQLPISNSVLSQRLTKLVDEGLLDRRVYQRNPPRAEYLVTPRGRSLWPMLVSIWDWERRWVPEHAEAIPDMRHTPCGALFVPLLTCRSCGVAVTEKELVAQWGPSGSWKRSVPAATTRRRSAADRRATPQSRTPGFPQTMSVLGNRWGLALLVAAFVGVSRFTDFQTQLGAPPGSVSDRLSIFVDNGVLVSTGNRYRLTEKGRAFLPVLISALQWAQQWFPAPEGPAVVLTHTACGAAFTAVLTCDQCTRPLRGTAVAAVQAEL